MPDAFDPYFKWLGIPKADQPPHAYRLLGIELFESDADVISNAADGRMAQIKSFQTGRFAAVSQKLLNEIAAAKVCLLNPQKKVEYDQRLQAHLQQKVAANPNLGKPEIAADHDHEYKVPDMVPAVGAEEGVASLPFIDFSTTPTRSTTRLAKRGKQPAWIIPAGVGAAAIALVAGVAVYFSFAGDNKDKSANPQTADHGYVVPVAGDPRGCADAAQAVCRAFGRSGHRHGRADSEAGCRGFHRRGGEHAQSCYATRRSSDVDLDSETGSRAQAEDRTGR